MSCWGCPLGPPFQCKCVVERRGQAAQTCGKCRILMMSCMIHLSFWNPYADIREKGVAKTAKKEK